MKTEVGKEMSVDDLLARLNAIPEEELKRVLEKHFEEHEPNKDGSCKQEGCTGIVVQSVCGLSSIGYHYGLPTCNTCGRQYFFTGDMQFPVVGMKEFEEMMNTPFTI